MHLFDILRHFRLFPNIDNRRLKKANRIQGNGKKVDLKFVSIFQFLKKIHIRLKLFEFQEFFLNGTLVLKQTLGSKKRSMGNCFKPEIGNLKIKLYLRNSKLSTFGVRAIPSS